MFNIFEVVKVVGKIWWTQKFYEQYAF